MNATARLTFDRQYYEAKYDDWLQHRAKWRKYAVPFACFLVLSGLCLSYFIVDQWMFGGFVIVGGIFELVTALTYRYRWINRCLRATCTDKTVEIKFENDLMNSSSRNGTSSIKIAALDSVVPASNGVFLIPDSGSSIYIPQSTVDPPDEYQALVQYLITSLETRENVKQHVSV